jgi:hypothetical protein
VILSSKTDGGNCQLIVMDDSRATYPRRKKTPSQFHVIGNRASSEGDLHAPQHVSPRFVREGIKLLFLAKVPVLGEKRLLNSGRRDIPRKDQPNAPKGQRPRPTEWTSPMRQRVRGRVRQNGPAQYAKGSEAASNRKDQPNAPKGQRPRPTERTSPIRQRVRGRVQQLPFAPVTECSTVSISLVLFFSGDPRHA